MSKKSFKGNPALQFMSSRPEPSEVMDGVAGDGEVISSNDSVNFMYQTETKSKRFNMLLRPSLFVDLQRCAKERNLSVNEYIHGILEASVANNRERSEGSNHA